MTDTDLAALGALLEKATKGPWRWEVSVTSKRVQLCGGPPRRGFGAYDLTVMDFVRWGLNNAAPRFWRWSEKNIGDPKRADEVAVPVAGREHHESWFRDIDDPNAALIVAAVNALPALLEEVRALRGGWQTMESAPKDGAQILACWADARGDQYGVIAWQNDNDHVGWVENCASVGDPTHWRPLPAPPPALLTPSAGGRDEG